MIAVGIVVGVVVVAGLFFALRSGSADKNKSGEAKSGDPAAAAGVAANAPGTPVGTKYVPRESEKKLEEFLNAQADRIVTDEEVFAIMGEPTRRDAAQTGRKNGQVFTIYTAHWEAPDGSIRSQISFANGRVAGMILGLETKPRK
ncbi:hypothetical protein [Limnoglobus roseus]|uniref:Uncharacterized protein n=1 Tax=Limnoglobus roseus TaxID=2598579 RepID=A0A5C1A2I0_9BACT|nr:hypothetical protein [Limnoglobus roseus]QEL13341.1 hypothetical protein PX52LOC_00195 [Limnoglobus roseus]